jgi:hypothetical protein
MPINFFGHVRSPRKLGTPSMRPFEELAAHGNVAEARSDQRQIGYRSTARPSPQKDSHGSAFFIRPKFSLSAVEILPR